MEHNLTQDIGLATEALINGGTILYPTDTIWGIGADATNEDAVRKIFTIKKRKEDKSFVVLMSDLRMINQYVTQLPLGIEDVYATFYKPTSVIYNNAINLADNAINLDGSIAIRIPNDDFCKRLIKKLGRPIISTSANISGQPSPSHYAAIDYNIKKAVDYIVHHRRDDTDEQSPSRIVKIGTDGQLAYIR